MLLKTSAGCDRSLLALMCDAYRLENEGDKDNERVVMKFAPHLAPIKVAVLPLVKKDIVAEPARKLFNEIQQSFKAEYDVTQSIGKRYRRQDEIGTPFCVTYDFDSNEDQKVTVRNRDTMQQERVSLDKVHSYLQDKMKV